MKFLVPNNKEVTIIKIKQDISDNTKTCLYIEFDICIIINQNDIEHSYSCYVILSSDQLPKALAAGYTTDLIGLEDNYLIQKEINNYLKKELRPSIEYNKNIFLYFLITPLEKNECNMCNRSTYLIQLNKGSYCINCIPNLPKCSYCNSRFEDDDISAFSNKGELHTIEGEPENDFICNNCIQYVESVFICDHCDTCTSSELKKEIEDEFGDIEEICENCMERFFW